MLSLVQQFEGALDDQGVFVSAEVGKASRKLKPRRQRLSPQQRQFAASREPQ